MSTMFLSCTYETYNQESRCIFNIATPHSSPISSTWDFYYSLIRNSLNMMCIEIPGLLDITFIPVLWWDFIMEAGMNPVNTRRYPDMMTLSTVKILAELQWRLLAMAAMFSLLRLFSPRTLRPFVAAPLKSFSSGFFFFSQILFSLMYFGKFSRFWSPNFTITFSWAGSSSFDGGWCGASLIYILSP